MKLDRLKIKISSICLFIFISTFLFITVSSCEIGLGKAVDTEVPEIAVETPAAGAIIRDSFAISGNWSDDGTISEVSLLIKNTENNNEYGPYEVSFTTGENGTGTWSYTVDKALLPDGTYEAIVTITDDMEHQSEVQRQITIDNTSPILVLQRPSTKANAVRAIESYGRIFTVEGQAADDSGIGLLEVNVYSDANLQHLLKTISFTNVPNTISLDVAEFVKDVSNDYSAIYGSTSEDAGEKKLYCSIVAYDGAKRYPPNGSAQTADDLKGNPTEVYYLYSEIADNFLSEHKITELYSMKSGRSGGPSIIKSMPSIDGNSFTLNPRNNPTYSIAGFAEIAAASTKDDYEAANLTVNSGDFVTIQVEPGLDGHLIEKDTLRVKVKRASDDALVTVSEQSISKDGDKYRIIAYLKKEDGLANDTPYRIEVEGKDEKGIKIVTPRGIGYGFVLKKSIVSPTLEVKDPAREDEIVLNEEKNGLRIKGSVLFPGEICNGGDVIVKATNAGVTHTWKVGSYTKDANTEWEFNLNLKKGNNPSTYTTTDSTGASVTYDYLPDGKWEFSIYAEYQELVTDPAITPETKTTTKITRNYKVDTTKPVTPVLKKVAGDDFPPATNPDPWYSSQNLSIEVDSHDTATENYSTGSGVIETWYKVNTEDWTKLSETNKGYINAGLNEGENELWFKNKDEAGNESLPSASPVIIKVDTSVPEIEKVFIGDGDETNNDWLELEAGKVKNIKSAHGKKLKIQIKENNSLPANGVTVKVGGSDWTPADSTPTPVSGSNPKKWIWTSGTEDLPFTADTSIEIKIQARDSSGGNSKEVTYYFLVDTQGPEIEWTAPYEANGENLVSTATYTISATINDESGSVASTKYQLTSAATPDDNNWISLTGDNIRKLSLPLTIDRGNNISGNITNERICEGTWYIYIKTEDDVGNSSTSQREFVTDLDPPDLVVTNPPAEKYNESSLSSGNTITVSGTARDVNQIEKVEYTTDGRTWTQIADITPDSEDPLKIHWQFSKTFGTGGNLADGKYQFAVMATDNAGKETPREFNVLIDTNAPSIDTKDIRNPTNLEWFKTTTVVPQVTASDNISNTNGLTVEYKIVDPDSNDASDWTPLVNMNGTFTSGIKVTNNGANKVYFRVTDEAGNSSDGSDYCDVKIDTIPPAIAITSYQVEGQTVSTDFAKTVYVDGNSNLTFTGTYTDEHSGVAQALAFNLSGQTIDSSKVTVTYTDGGWTAEIDKEVLENGTLGVRGQDIAGNVKYAEQTLSIIKDTDNPVISNVSVKETTENAKTKAYLSSAEDADPLVYYVNNANKDNQHNTINKKFTISGLSSDANNIVSTTLKIGSVEYSDNKGTPGSWSFDIEDLHTYSGTEVSVEIISTDPAGKTAVDHKTITLKFDNAGPDFRHGIDAKGKDVDFRVGEYENDYHEEDVGGKYQVGTWGTALSIKVRGTVTDDFDPDSNTSTGSGLSKVYYKVFTAEPTEGATFNKDDENVGVIEASSLLAKWVDYTKSDGDKDRVSVTSSFKGEIKGLKEGANYILLLAEDNVGNIKQDSMTAVAATNLVTLDPEDDVTGNYYKWNEKKAYYSLNVDTLTPDIDSTTRGTQYSNGSKKVTVTGTCKDTGSGIDDVTVTVTIGTGAEATKTATTTIDRTKTPYEWTAEFSAAQLAQIVDGETYTIDATAKDKAGLTTSLTAAILQGDKKAPTASLISMTKSVEKSGDYYIRPTKDEVKVKGTTDDKYSSKVKTYLKLVPYVSDPAAESSTEIKYISTAAPAEAVTAVIPTEARTWELTIPANTLTLTGFKGANLYACTEDEAGNISADDEGDILLATLIYDETPPASVDPDDIAIGGGGDENTWHKNTSLSLSETWKDENGAGVDKVYYKLVHDTTEPAFDEDNWATDGWTAFTGAENNSGNYAFENTIAGFNDGANNFVYMYAVDKLGNAVTSLHKITVKVDTQNPIATDGYEDTDGEVYNFTDIYLTNGGAHKILYFYIEDAHSGINESSVAVKLGNVPVELGENKSKVEFIAHPDYPTDPTKKLVKVTLHKDILNDNGHRAVVVSLQDNAGNYTDKTIGTLNMDITPPTVKLNAPKDADSETTDVTEVNGTITITGSATDTYLRAKPLTGFQYLDLADVNNTWLDLYDNLITNTKVTNDADFSVEINTKAAPFTDGQSYKIKAQVTDEAGNTAWSTPVEFKVDQDTDRPVIKFTNLELPATSGTTESEANITLFTDTLKGTIIDDDGIDSFKIYLVPQAGDTKEDTITVKSDGWSYKFDKDNTYEVVFKVKDGEGTEFTARAAASASTLLSTPKLTDGANWLGTHTAGSHTEFSLKVDTNPPVTQNMEFKLSSAATWTSSLPLLGGPEDRLLNNKFDLRLIAADESGIDSVVGILDGDEVHPYTATPEETDYYPETIQNREVKCKHYQFPTIDVSSLSGGLHSLELTITDGAGSEKKETVSLSIDREAPVVTIVKPTINSLESASIWANGTITGAKDKGLKYAISTHGDAAHKPADILADASVITAWEEYDDTTNTTTSNSFISTYKPVYSSDMAFGITWNIYFDNDTSSTADTHDKLLNQYLIDMGITTEAALRATEESAQFNKLVKLYLWMKSEDEVGNVTETAFPIILDPQGDRPTLSFTYPAEAGTTLGGKVTVYGTVEDTLGDHPGVDTVWVQPIATHWKLNPDWTEESTEDTPKFIKDTTSGWGSFTANTASEITAFSLTTTDLDYLAALTYTENGQTKPYYQIYNMKTYKGDGTDQPWRANSSTVAPGYTVKDYAVKARLSGTAWMLDINNNKEFDPSGSGKSPLAMRLYARDKDGKFSIKFDRLVQFDANKPVISNLKLVQYKDAANNDFTETASQAYGKDVFVRGEWWLTGTVTDGDMIGSLTINGEKLVEETNPVTGKAKWATGHTTDKDVVEFRFKLSTGETGTVGEQSVNIIAKDAAEGTPNEQNETLTVKFDNKAPVIADAATGREINAKVQQYNGFYKFSSKATEADEAGKKQSGFAYTAFFFKRHYGTTTKLYDVLQKRDKAEIDISTKETATKSLPVLGKEDDDADDNDLVTKDGLYWFVKEVVTNDTMSITMTDTTHVHKNSLMLIGGTYYLVDSVGSGTVTFTRKVPAGYSRAYVALAGIVNNSNEGHADNAKPQDNGYYAASELNRDDGDGMIEDVSKLDTTWTWEANICSRNIPDGPIDIVYVVYDQAGNSDSDTVSGYVCNNQPRIAGVTIATDYTGNNVAETVKTEYTAENLTASEDSVTGDNGATPAKKVYDPYSKSLNKNTLKSLAQTMTAGSAASPVLKVRGLTQITPEIVGGNGTVYYSYSIENTTKTLADNSHPKLEGTGSKTTTALYSETDPEHTLNYDYTINNSAPINLQLGDLVYLGDTTTGIPFKFTFKDDTEGLSSLTAAQKTALENTYDIKFEADLTVYLAINACQETTPTASIEPFYWKSLKDNSIYGSKTASSYKELKGHIELEKDWKETDTYKKTGEFAAATYSLTEGEYDADPKVSGEIVLKGKAHDDKLLKKIEISINGVNKEVATYNTTSGLLVSKFAADAYDTNGISFIIDKQTVDSNGHSVEWTLNWNTQNTGFVPTAKKDVGVTVIATNGGVPKRVTEGGTLVSVDGTTKYVADAVEKVHYSNEGTEENPYVQVQTGSTKDANNNVINTDFYRMDVVPYVMNVETYLSDANKNNPSVYSRTALGHYPVYMTHAKGNGAYTPESNIKIYGFNLKGGSIALGGTSNNSQTLVPANGYYTFTLPSGAKTGKATVTVGTGANAVESLNNRNNDDSNGSSGKTTDKRAGDSDIYGTYFYNRQPNGENNNRLTDDLFFDVWDFNSQAVVSQDNSCLDIMMKINPSNGLIGFAFCDGTLHWSMAGKDDNGNAISYRSWASARDFIQLTGFGYDSYGNSYGTAAGGESSGEDKADSYCFYTSRWGNSGITAHQSNHSRIECTAQKTNSNNENVFTLDKKRFHNPTFAAHTDSSTTHNTDLYLAYYDAVNGEIRFRAGSINDNTGARAQFGSFIDRYSDNNQDGTRPKDYSYNTDDFQILANGAGANLGTAGEFLSLGVTSDNVVVIIWYDGTNLKLSYNTDPLTLATGTNKGGWKDAETISSGASKYCQLVIDGADNIHVAAFDNANGDLKYIYIPIKTKDGKHIPDFDNKKECIVDSYLSVGKELTIDVAGETIDGTLRYIPHIGYYGTTPKKPRYAYLADPTAFFAAEDVAGRSGTNEDMYTGIWECGVVPSKSTITIDAKRRINVGVWKKSDGTRRNSYYTKDGPDTTGVNKNGSSTAASKSGTCYGNGTQNAVLAYGVQFSKMRDYVETAQMR